MDYYANASADNIRLARSKVIMAPADGTHNVIRLPNKAFSIDVFISIISPYSSGSTGTITVGIDGPVTDPDGLLTSTYIDPNTAGISRASGGTAALAEGYWFSQTGAITLTSAIGNSSAEITCEVFAFYSVIH